jgi:putative transposase
MPQLSHKIKIYPNEETKVYFAKACGIKRFAYNWALARWKEKYKAGEKGISGFSLVKEWNAIKESEYPWALEVSKWVPQKAIQDLGEAFVRFFEKKAKYPKFKKKGRCRESFYLGQSALRIKGKRFKIPKLGWVKMAQEVRFPGEIKSVTISKVGSDWFASFSVDLDDSYIYPHCCENQAVVGVDLGVKKLAVFSNETSFDAPRSYRRFEKKLKRANRALSRKVKGSKRRAKAKLTLSKAHLKVKRIREAKIHEITAYAAKNFRVIGVEDLNVRGMLKNHKLAKSVSDASFGEFLRQIQYKALLGGSWIAQADRYFPSSKLCSDCGYKLETLDLSVREWACPDCGVVHDRDLNAAQNLEKVARSYWETLNARGEVVRPKPLKRIRRSSKKRELQLVTSCK